MNMAKKNLLILSFVFIIVSCTPKKVEQTPPPKKEKSKEEIFSEYRAKASADTNIYKVYKVIERYGRQTKKHKSYKNYKGNVNNVVQNDIFYDSYVLEVNVRKDWFKVTYNSAKAAASQDKRVKDLIEGTPLNSIDMLLTTARSIKYLLSDTNGDGILDFAMPKSKRMAEKMTIKDKMALLDKMQLKYTSLLSTIKKSYKNIRK